MPTKPRPLVVSKSDLLPLYIAHNLDPKAVPRECIARTGDSFVGGQLKAGNRVVAQFYKPTRGKELVLLIEQHRKWTRTGWSTVFLWNALDAERDPRVIMFGVDAPLKLSFKMLHRRFWKDVGDTSSRATMLHIAKLAGYNMRRFRTPPRSLGHLTKKFEPPKNYRWNYSVSEKAKDILQTFTPEWKEEKRRERIEVDFQNRQNHKRWNALRPSQHEMEKAESEYRNATPHIPETPELIGKLLTHWGHIPKSGEFFKRFIHRGSDVLSRSHAYKWPAVGEWTPPVDGQVVACSNGFHLVTADNLHHWGDHGSHVYLVEGDGDQHYSSTDGGKTAFRRARLVKYLGEITQSALRLVSGGDDITEAQIAELLRRFELAQGNMRLAQMGYAECLAAAGTPEQIYVRFKIGENLGGDDAPFGAGYRSDF